MKNDNNFSNYHFNVCVINIIKTDNNYFFTARLGGREHRPLWNAIPEQQIADRRDYEKPGWSILRVRRRH